MIIVKEKREYRKAHKPQIIMSKRPSFVEIVCQMTPEFIPIELESV
jgi:hypothetical protein